MKNQKQIVIELCDNRTLGFHITTNRKSAETLFKSLANQNGLNPSKVDIKAGYDSDGSYVVEILPCQ
jgi:hypothetical protein